MPKRRVTTPFSCVPCREDTHSKACLPSLTRKPIAVFDSVNAAFRGRYLKTLRVNFRNCYETSLLRGREERREGEYYVWVFLFQGLSLLRRSTTSGGCRGELLLMKC